jgi:protein SCO1
MILAIAGSTSAHAAITQAALDDLAVKPGFDAALPPGLRFVDEDGQPRTFDDILDGKPAVVVFADYTCRTLCGPILTFLASGLEHSGLVPGADYDLVVIGLDPRDDLQSARDLKAARIGSGTPLATATVMLTGEAATIETATSALGYRYTYDAEHDQFAHPAAAFVVTPAGRVSRVLSALGLDGPDVRLALVEAGQGRVGSLGDRLRLLCYGFDAARGIYTETITLWLELAAIGTVSGMAAAVAAMNARSRRAALPAAPVSGRDARETDSS